MTSPDERDLRSDATALRRKPERGRHDSATVHAIIDEALVAHVGFVVDDQPFVIPMVFGRDGDRLFLHGSVASRLLRTLDRGVRVCVTFTLLDALVVARSHFHHSMNYRSVVLLGTATRIRDVDDARRALERIVDHVIPGRSAEARPPTAAEIKQTAVLELPISEASAKARTGPPIEEPEDLGTGAWGGLVPVTTTFGPPQHDAQDPAPELPRSLTTYSRP